MVFAALVSIALAPMLDRSRSKPMRVLKPEGANASDVR
jgi:hypothetical protein